MKSKNRQLNEAIDAFKNKEVKTPETAKGEGWEYLTDLNFGVGVVGTGSDTLKSLNMFYNSLFNKEHENEVGRMSEYRDMAKMTEISDVIEDATNESTQTDTDGKIVKLEIVDSNLIDNENIVNNLNLEFEKLFEGRLNFKEKVWDLIRTYYVDGRVFYEKIINTKKTKEGIHDIRKLPSETMDYISDQSGNPVVYFQYLKKNTKKPLTLAEAEKRDDIIVFHPEQIEFINYGIYGRSRYQIEGYLEKVRVPYNQLKLLETSVIIYRIVRAPERLVFRIDTGNMPREKAHKYTEKIKNAMIKKQTYDPKTGALSQEPEVLSILENYYLPQSADGRGSQIESVGGNSAGFSELDDIYYFARKLYRALKYPASRVSAGEEKREADIMFGGSSTGEISRDEIKWSKFLQRQQAKFEASFTDLFLLHLDFKGLKKQYGLNNKKIKVVMTPPSNYKEQMDQNFLESRFNNYSTLADRPEMSKYYLMKKYLKWSDEEIQENVNGRKKDEQYGFIEDDSF